MINPVSRILDLLDGDKDEIYNRGIEALKGGDIPGAIKLFSKVISLNPSDAHAQYNLAYCLGLQKNYAESARRYREFSRLGPDEADDDLREYITVLERAASAEKGRAEEIVNSYLAHSEQLSSEVYIAGTRIRFDTLLTAADDFLFSGEFSDATIRDEMATAMSAKIPLRFYAVKPLQSIDPRDAFGFAIAFASAGYSVAKASLKLLGEGAYHAALPKDISPKIQFSKQFYEMGLMKRGNPIPWKLVRRVLDACIESNLKNFLEKMPVAAHSAEAIRKHLVEEFVLTGYYLGLRENATAQ
ncbi:MAG TPA: tetratricopeptide repeat protein [Terriglobia bacterium]|nr:tetratricopeptide repeat protein [Terriglobia bacterium]